MRMGIFVASDTDLTHVASLQASPAVRGIRCVRRRCFQNTEIHPVPALDRGRGVSAFAQAGSDGASKRSAAPGVTARAGAAAQPGRPPARLVHSADVSAGASAGRALLRVVPIIVRLMSGPGVRTKKQPAGCRQRAVCSARVRCRGGRNAGSRSSPEAYTAKRSGTSPSVHPRASQTLGRVCGHVDQFKASAFEPERRGRRGAPRAGHAVAW